MTAPESPPGPPAPAPKKGILPWIILALWFVWVGVLVAMSLPHWGESKKNLLQLRDRSDEK